MSHQRETTIQKNLDIECLRGIAIIAVFLAHIKNLTKLGPALPEFLGQGGAGVQLFFVISGYVVGMSLIVALARAETLGARAGGVLPAFYVRRFFRIVPLAIAGVLLALLLHSSYALVGVHGLGPLAADLRDIVTLRLNYAFIRQVENHPLAHYWSLIVEEHFYLGLPIVLLVVRDARLRRLLLGAVIVLTLFFLRPTQVLFDRPFAESIRMMLYGSHLLLDFFAAGVLLALRKVAGARIKLPRGRWALNVLSCGLMIFVIGFGHPDIGRYPPMVLPMILVASTVLVFLASEDQGLLLPSGWARNTLSYIGGRSYGIYLLHYPIILGFESLRDPVVDGPGFVDALLVVGAALTTVAMAELCFRAIERPLIQVGTRLAAKIVAARSPAS